MFGWFAMPSAKLAYLWNITIFIGKSSINRSCSITMLVYWRVNSIEQQFMLQSASKTVIRVYPPVIKRGNGKSIIDEGCNGNIIYERGIFQPAMFDYRKVPIAQVWSQLAAAWNVWSISFRRFPVESHRKISCPRSHWSHWFLLTFPEIARSTVQPLATKEM